MASQPGEPKGNCVRFRFTSGEPKAAFPSNGVPNSVVSASFRSSETTMVLPLTEITLYRDPSFPLILAPI